MITKNDYEMRLFNGDVGLILPDPERNGEPGAFFRNAGGGLRCFAPVRLRAHETVFALTVHKSQGLEFDNILMILPDSDAPVLTRELIYTAVTRARKSVTVWGEEALLSSGPFPAAPHAHPVCATHFKGMTNLGTDFKSVPTTPVASLNIP